VDTALHLFVVVAPPLHWLLLHREGWTSLAQLVAAMNGENKSFLAEKLNNKGFKVVDLLKGAGHATIFRVKEAYNPSGAAYVAKVISLDGLDPKGRASALQEVSLLKGLVAHPNLIGFRESFVEEEILLYMIMSLAEDGDLRHVVTESQASKRIIPEPVVLTWVRQTLLGLSHLHAQAVVHRDLKTSNIFLCDHHRRILIGDFGISKVLESTAFASSCVGTPAYMSPELMRNERYDYHVDMWALGCIIFELCTLHLPFVAQSLLDLACKIMEQHPAWSLWMGYTEELRHVAQCLLCKDATIRPSATELLSDGLFSEGGLGALEPPEEAWAAVTQVTEGTFDSPTKNHEDPMSQLTTAVTKESMSSNDGTWTTTPRKPWESGSQGCDTASLGGTGSTMDSELQRAREMPLTQKEDFAQLLSTHSEQFLQQHRGLGPVSNSAVDVSVV